MVPRCDCDAAQLGGDGEELGADVLPLLAFNFPSGINLTCRPHPFRRRLFRHHLIRSSSQRGGGERASTDYFALKLNASSQGVINCDCGG
jgi:hypothetical protein